MTTVYRLLHRLKYTILHPRPRHPKKDDEQSEIFKMETVPEAIETVCKRYPQIEILLYFQDEMRAGLQRTLTRVWAGIGTRPPALRQMEYECGYVFWAICPATGEISGFQLVYKNYDELVDALCHIWNHYREHPEAIQSLAKNFYLN